MRAIGRIILCAVFLLLTVMLAAVASYMPQIFFQYYTAFSGGLLAKIADVTGFFPVAVWQVLLVLIALLALYGLVQVFVRHHGLLDWLSGMALLLCIGLFLFTGLWAANHYGPSIAERLHLNVEQYSVEQLRTVTAYMADQASTWADRVERDENGDLAVDFFAMAKTAGKSYVPLAAKNEFFNGSTAPVKYLMAGKLISYTGTTGMFVPFTGESGVNPDTYAASIPYTMCHEVAHRLTVAPENEANFCAFLACQASDDPAFQYSGWYSAFIYCYNALYQADRERAFEIYNGMSELVQHDCHAANTHYAQYEGQVQDAAQKVNDTYLKAFSEESGVQSYGEVVDLLLAWYFARN